MEGAGAGGVVSLDDHTMSTTSAPTIPPKPRRRWLQFSLRTLMVLMLIWSIPCGWVAWKVRQAREQRQAVEAVMGMLGHVLYEPKGIPAPKFLQPLLGDDFFCDVWMVGFSSYKMVTVSGMSYPGTQVTDSGLVHLKRFPKLKRLYLGNTQVTDAGLVNLKGLARLERLDLSGTRVTDAGVAELQKALPNCQILQ